jgi:hypothetical protein
MHTVARRPIAACSIHPRTERSSNSSSITGQWRHTLRGAITHARHDNDRLAHVRGWRLRMRLASQFQFAFAV